MSGQPDLVRRGFLRDLVRLPLIGGGVTLIGNPTAVAEPATSRLVDEYGNFLTTELWRLASERCLSPNWHRVALHGPAHDWHLAECNAGRNPSSRAAVVLSAVGIDWRRP